MEDWLKRRLQKRHTKGLSRVWMRMWERRLLRELKPRWQMTQRMRPVVLAPVSTAWKSSGDDRRSGQVLPSGLTPIPELPAVLTALNNHPVPPRWLPCLLRVPTSRHNQPRHCKISGWCLWIWDGDRAGSRLTPIKVRGDAQTDPFPLQKGISHGMRFPPPLATSHFSCTYMAKAARVRKQGWSEVVLRVWGRHLPVPLPGCPQPHAAATRSSDVGV